MQTDTKSLGADACSDSSTKNRRASSSAGLRQNSPTRSANVQAEDAGGKVEPKLSLSDYLLTILQSDLSELKQSGVGVKLYKMAEGTQIALQGVRVCQEHQILHSGLKCHQCE